MANDCGCGCQGGCRIEELVKDSIALTPELIADKAPGCDPKQCMERAAEMSASEQGSGKK